MVTSLPWRTGNWLLRSVVVWLLLNLVACGKPGHENQSADHNSGNGHAVYSGTPSSGSVTLQAMRLENTSQTLVVGIVNTLRVWGDYSDGTTRDITAQVVWNTSDGAIFQMQDESHGLSLRTGTVTLTARMPGSTLSVSTSLVVDNATLVGLNILPAAVTLQPGQGAKLRVLASFSNGKSYDVTPWMTFTNDAPTVAQVSTTGAVTALQPGMAHLQAQVSAYARSVWKINQPDNSRGRHRNANHPKAHTNDKHEGEQEAEHEDEDEDDDNPWVAKAVVTVNAVTLQGITVSGPTVNLAKGLSQQMTATGNYSDGTTANLTNGATWASSNPAVASITAGGLVTAVALGTTTLTATDTATGVVGSVSLTVTPAILQSMSLAPATMSLAKGLSQQMTATGSYSDGTTANITGQVTWSSSNVALAAVTPTGVAQALGIGAVTLTATDATTGVMASASLTITPAIPVSMTLSSVAAPVAMGLGVQLSVLVNYTDGTTNTSANPLTWTSSAPLVASVSAMGWVTALNIGQAVITVTDAVLGFTASTTVTVSAPKPVSISVVPSPGTVGVYQQCSGGFFSKTCWVASSSYQFYANAAFTDGRSYAVTYNSMWSVSNTSMATISGGLAYANINKGFATGMISVYADYQGIRGQGQLNVQ